MASAMLSAFALAFSSCKKDDSNEKFQPSAKLEIVSCSGTEVVFSVSAENAEECAYVLTENKGFVPSTAEEILKSGQSVELADQKAEVSAPVTEGIEYALIAAVSGKGGKAVTEKIVFIAEAGEEPEQKEDYDETFGSAQLVYHKDGTIIFNLLSSAKLGKVSVQINGLAGGALRGNSHLIVDGVYPTISPAYLLDENGEGDIDNPLEKGASVNIKSVGDAKSIEVTGKLADGSSFKGAFSGNFEKVGSEFELKDYSLKGIRLDQSGPGKWTDNMVEIPLGSTYDIDKVSQVTLQFITEEKALPEGTYTVSGDGKPGTVKLAKVYLDETRWVWPLEYESGTVKVTHDGKAYTFEINLAGSFDSNYRKYASADIVYGGTFEGVFTGTVQNVGTEPGSGEPDPGDRYTEEIDYTDGSVLPAAEYGYSAEYGGYYGKIYFTRPTEDDMNTCLFFLNKSPQAETLLDPDSGMIEFLPGISYMSFGTGDNESTDYYKLTEGEVQLSYDKTSGNWNVEFRGVMTNIIIGTQWNIITHYTGKIEGFDKVAPK